jgi:hypothetical protein
MVSQKLSEEGMEDDEPVIENEYMEDDPAMIESDDMENDDLELESILRELEGEDEDDRKGRNSSGCIFCCAEKGIICYGRSRTITRNGCQ